RGGAEPDAPRVRRRPRAGRRLPRGGADGGWYGPRTARRTHRLPSALLRGLHPRPRGEQRRGRLPGRSERASGGGQGRPEGHGTSPGEAEDTGEGRNQAEGESEGQAEGEGREEGARPQGEAALSY